MDKTTRNSFTATVIVAVAMGVASGSALAGGLLAIDFNPGNFSNPQIIDNPYWPLNPDGTNRIFTYIGETEDECPGLDEVPLGGDLREFEEECTEGSWEAGQYGPDEEIIAAASSTSSTAPIRVRAWC